MPIYEYSCAECGRQMSFLVLSTHSFRPRCKFCESQNLEQLFSRFASPKSEERRVESLVDPSNFAGLDESDPGSVTRWMKKMGKEMGDEAGTDFEQMADEAAQEATASGGEGNAKGGTEAKLAEEL